MSEGLAVGQGRAVSQQVCGKNAQRVSLKLTAAWPADGAVVRSMMTSCQLKLSQAASVAYLEDLY